MATELENLKAARSGYIAKLAQLANETDYYLTYTDQGRTFSWTEYQAFLTDQVDKLTKQIAAVGGPVRVRSYGRAVN